MKGISGRTPLRGNKTKSSVAIWFKETTSPVINSSNNSNKSFRDDKEGTKSSKNLSTLLEGVHVQRDFDVVFNVESPRGESS